MPGKDRRTTARAASGCAPRGTSARGGALLALLLLATAGRAAATASGPTTADCLRCHADPARAPQLAGGGATTPRVDLGRLKDSVHAELTCVECHRELAGKDVASGHVALPRSAAGSAERGERMRQACGGCHAGHEVEAGSARRAPRAAGFRSGYHGLGTVGSTPYLADCSSCHQPHAVLKAADPRNPLGAANLATTCGQASCHEGTTASLARGEVHGGLTPDRREFLSLVRATYILTILVTVAAMILHNALHFLGRRRARRMVHG